ncbi:RHS repeat-associated core domain-containing protein [Weeksellaceae bacterium A-14]
MKKALFILFIFASLLVFGQEQDSLSGYKIDNQLKGLVREKLSGNKENIQKHADEERDRYIRMYKRLLDAGNIKKDRYDEIVKMYTERAANRFENEVKSQALQIAMSREHTVKLNKSLFEQGKITEGEYNKRKEQANLASDKICNCITDFSGPEEKDVYWYHYDHLGSTSFITGMDGEVVQNIEYFPSGETFVENHLNSPNSPYKYNAKELDDETGYYYYGARYYNPRTSLWLNVDPLAMYDPKMNSEHYIDGQHNGGVYNSGNLNPYIYTYNNPIIYTDPNGKQVNVVIDGMKKIWNDWNPFNKASQRMNGESERDQNRRLAESTMKNMNNSAEALATKQTAKDLFNIATRHPDQKLLKFSELLQNTGDVMSVAGYALTISVVGAEVGVPLAALGNTVSTTGDVIEITVKLSQSDLKGAASKTGWLIAGELVDLGVSKIPGITNKQAKTLRENLTEEILKQNAGLKLKVIENAVDQKTKK